MNVNIRDAIRVEIRYGFRRVKELSGTTILAAVVVAIVLTATVSRVVKKGLVQLPEAPRLQVIVGGRPPIGDCPEEILLWECIRHAQYLEEKK